MDTEETVTDAVVSPQDPTATAELSENNAKLPLPQRVYRYNCVRCNLNYHDLDLLKEHYFEKHISVNSGGTQLKSKKPVKKLGGGGSSRPKRQAKRTKSSVSNLDTEEEEFNDNDDDYVDTNENANNNNNNAHSRNTSTSSASFRTNSSITIKKRRKIEPDPIEEVSDLDKRMAALTEEEIKTFNLDGIDEAAFIEAIGDGACNKKRDLLAGRVVWAQWRSSVMWPALIVKVHQNSKVTNSLSGLKIHIRYFEMHSKLGKVFKLDPSKVELFYKCKEHGNYKVLGTVNQEKRKEFFVAYTNALKDYKELLESSKQNGGDVNTKAGGDEEKDEEAKKREEAAVVAIVKNTSLVNNNDKKYHVCGKKLTLDEVRELADKEYTQAQLAENKKREEASKKLMGFIMNDECKNFLIKIMTDNTVKCDRHKAYLNADSKSRRTQLNFTNIGPLTYDDSVVLGKHLTELVREHYADKPENLTAYEYDVLFPEAVIHGLRNMLRVSYKVAEKKWRAGFGSTKEEDIKTKCNDIINKLKATTESEAAAAAATQSEDEDVNNYESEYNEDDTSFFTYCSNTNADATNREHVANLEKTFNETVSMINDEDIDDKENLEMSQAPESS